ncbi:MutL protein [Photobacterium marinum]|uniref:MutL protein n=1 Tax=Photobacterium marinum TaxID=1056511 RepID=L8JFX8_9GAMM|nr:tyrosine-type recombinase/integrase [Photobacterium marinum]ELR67168.1 MutL protein [Photobacterium marinum]
MEETREQSNLSAEDSDFRLLEVEIDNLAKVKLEGKVNANTGEISVIPELDASPLKSYHKTTKILLAPDGTVVYPQSLYLVSKLRGEGKVDDTGSIALALLTYTRWLDSTHHPQENEDGEIIRPQNLTYKSLSKYEEEGAPWQFAEFLIANCRHRNSDGNEAYALSTARCYMNAVLGFYKWLYKEGYLQKDDERVVTHYSKVTTGFDNSINHNDMLAHTKKNSKPRQVEVSNIMKLFPKAESTEAHKKLKPLTLQHQDIFEEYVVLLPNPFPLMFRLSKRAGLRIDELDKFPAHQIGEMVTDGLDEVPIQITETKFSKPRTLQVPVDLYEELEIYKFSEQRMKNVTKRVALRQTDNDLDDTDYLFLSNKGKPYATNTLEVHFNNLRDWIVNDYPWWYYRPHDLRATFATNWLRHEAALRQVGYDFLMDELAELMGHEETSTTEKYIKYMNQEASQLVVAKRKNEKLQRGW